MQIKQQKRFKKSKKNNPKQAEEKEKNVIKYGQNKEKIAKQ